SVWVLYVGIRQRRRKTLLLALTLGGALFFVLRPDAATRAANLLGIGRGADLVFYFTTLAVLGCYYLILSIERTMRIEITELPRAIALLRIGLPAGHSGEERKPPDLEHSSPTGR